MRCWGLLLRFTAGREGGGGCIESAEQSIFKHVSWGG